MREYDRRDSVRWTDRVTDTRELDESLDEQDGHKRRNEDSGSGEGRSHDGVVVGRLGGSHRAKLGSLPGSNEGKGLPWRSV